MCRAVAGGVPQTSRDSGVDFTPTVGLLSRGVSDISKNSLRGVSAADTPQIQRVPIWERFRSGVGPWAQPDKVLSSGPTILLSRCHPERSEGSMQFRRN